MIFLPFAETVFAAQYSGRSTIRNAEFIGFYSESHGGAIDIMDSDFPLEIAEAVFIECRAAFNGGAMRLLVNTLDASLTSASMCSAGIKGQFAQINARSNCNIRQSSVTKCAKDYLCHNYGSIYLNAGVRSVLSLNSSQNVVDDYGSGMSSQGQESSKAKFIRFASNKGANTFYIHQKSSYPTIESSIFYNNTYEYKGDLWYSGHVALKEVYFINGRGIAEFAPVGWYTEIEFIDCYCDREVRKSGFHILKNFTMKMINW